MIAYCVRPASSRATTRSLKPALLLEAIRAGLPIRELNDLQANLQMPMERLALGPGISKATLNRRRREGTLRPDESDRVLQFARLVAKAIEVFETEEGARAPGSLHRRSDWAGRVYQRNHERRENTKKSILKAQVIRSRMLFCFTPQMPFTAGFPFPLENGG